VKVDLEKFEKLAIDDPEFAMTFAKIFKELKPHLEEYVASFRFDFFSSCFFFLKKSQKMDR